jgi:hypothetical protein
MLAAATLVATAASTPMPAADAGRQWEYRPTRDFALYRAAEAYLDQVDGADMPHSRVNARRLDPDGAYWFAGYVAATSEVLAARGVVCLPAEFARHDAALWTARVIRLTPHRWGEPPAALVESALVKAYPCSPV